MNDDELQRLRQRVAEMKDAMIISKDIFCEDSPKLRKLKISLTHLNEGERALLYLYAEIHSFRKMSELLGVSHMTCYREVSRIVKQIKMECL